MPISYVQVTEGSGRKIRSHQSVDGADTVEQWSVVLGEPFLAQYAVAVSTAVALTAANSHVLQIMAGASLRVGVRRIVVSQIVAATATAQCLFEVRRLTTAGAGGTAWTPNPTDPADAASGATAMTLPTAKGTEGVSLWEEVALLHQTMTTVGINRVLSLDWTGTRTGALWIAAGTSNGIALKNVTAISPATVHITAELVESAA